MLVKVNIESLLVGPERVPHSAVRVGDVIESERMLQTPAQRRETCTKRKVVSVFPFIFNRRKTIESTGRIVDGDGIDGQREGEREGDVAIFRNIVGRSFPAKFLHEIRMHNGVSGIGKI